MTGGRGKSTWQDWSELTFFEREKETGMVCQSGLISLFGEKLRLDNEWTKLE